MDIRYLTFGINHLGADLPAVILWQAGPARYFKVLFLNYPQ